MHYELALLKTQKLNN